MTPTLVTTAGPSSERSAPSLQIGFLTVLHEPSGYLGGFLVTNLWGRPLEFRLSSAVQPNRVQQILYAGTLQAYIHADLIGKNLVEKSSSPVHLLVTDREPVLDLRWKVNMPVVWLAPTDLPPDPQSITVPRGDGALAATNLLCHPRFPQDAHAARELLDQLDPSFDLTEPFTRVREAIAEARKLGVSARA